MVTNRRHLAKMVTYGNEAVYNSEMPSSEGGIGAAFLPRPDQATRVISAPGTGNGYWAGAPSAVAADDGVYLAYRLRRPIGQGASPGPPLSGGGPSVRKNLGSLIGERCKPGCRESAACTAVVPALGTPAGWPAGRRMS